MITASAAPATATDFTAGVMMEKMDANDRVSFISGIIEGLAYARFARDNEHVEGDKKTTTGMKCIYDWFYEKPHAIDLIYLASVNTRPTCRVRSSATSSSRIAADGPG